MEVIREALRLAGIVKKFGVVEANKGVSLSIYRGSIHAIVGENGAGKSTLARLVYGMLSPDEGELAVNDRPVRFSSPKEAIAAGIGMVHQHFMLMPAMTVTENIVLGIEPKPLLGLLPTARIAEFRSFRKTA